MANSNADPRPDDISGHVVVITGATRGIGRGIARHLGARGAGVVITGRKQERLDDTSAELTELGVEHLAVSADVGNKAANDQVVAAAVERFGRLDAVVANAQSFRPVTPLAEVSEADMDLLLNTGPKGTLWLMQAAYPHFVAQGRGRVVTMGTVMGQTGAPGYGPYAASNEAIRSLTRTAASEWGRDGVTVNCICPASAAHRANPDASPERKAAFEAMYDNHPLGRDGDPDTDIAPVVAFLLSDASQYVTGETIMVDGGGFLRA
jgi:NAD(P)-dependent dehydrogenase (short-subunit alcohol dehydrogenase family)